VGFNISFQSLRRAVLSLLTVFILIKLIFSLIATFDRPQIQGKFELYQTNLVLVASEWIPTGDLEGLGTLQKSIVGADARTTAIEQYQAVRKSDELAISKLDLQSTELLASATDDDRSTKLQIAAIDRTIAAARNEIDKLDLRIGILQSAEKQPQQAISTWQQIATNSPQSQAKTIANNLIAIWQQSSGIDKSNTAKIAAEFKSSFDGWFRDRALEGLYINVGDDAKLAQLDSAEQVRALDALIKLATITIPRGILGLAGVGLTIFFIVRFIIIAIQNRGSKSLADLLLTKLNIPWSSPWDWEIVWQVFILGFFFVGQFLLPFIFAQFVNPAQLTARGQGAYVFTSYVLMSALGVGVLYLSIKSYLPLPSDWFQFNWKSNWLLWGIGGYLVATPIVILVSLINDKIWHGQGGSNPLLQIVLEDKDETALWLFFLTAAVAAPLFEEFLFRGFLLPSLTRYLPVWGSIGVSGLLFGIAHLSLSEILPLTTLGIILGVVYARTRNLLAPMLLHSLWNSSTLVSLFILGSGK
jgi:uncharacterized protein